MVVKKNKPDLHEVLCREPAIRLYGLVDDALLGRFLDQLRHVRSQREPVVVELSTSGGDADVARRIAAAVRADGGLLSYEDLASYTGRVEPAVSTRFQGYDIHKAGFWSQGPALLMTFNILEAAGIAGMRLRIKEMRALLQSRAHGALAKGGRLATIGGSPPDLANLPPGCAFADRCPMAQDACRSTQPEPVVLAPGHLARCLRTDATAALASPV